MRVFLRCLIFKWEYNGWSDADGIHRHGCVPPDEPWFTLVMVAGPALTQARPRNSKTRCKAPVSESIIHFSQARDKNLEWWPNVLNPYRFWHLTKKKKCFSWFCAHNGYEKHAAAKLWTDRRVQYRHPVPAPTPVTVYCLLTYSHLFANFMPL